MACSSCEIPNVVNTSTGGEFVCYCFNHTMEDIQSDFQLNGVSTIEKSIRTAVEAGSCSCELKNPQGKCCLGDVRAAYKGLEAVATTSNID